jgi:DNA-binding beta-propeller fold protein YncE
MAFFCFAKRTFSTRYNLILLTFLVLGLNACKDDDGGPEVTRYESGIFIANEGPFQNGSGTVSFWDRATGETTQDIFATANAGEPAGNILQSIHFHNGKVYLVVNNAGKIIVADGETFEKEAEILGLAQPRYILPVSNDKAFVTQWGADGLTGSVALVNLKTFTVEKTIPTGSGPEKMLQIGDRLYVANSGGGFGGIDSTLAVIDLTLESFLYKITVGKNPNSLVVDKNGAIWVGTSGFYDWSNPSNPLNSPGSLSKLENGAATLTVTLPDQAYDLTINSDGDQLFFLENNYGGAVFELGIDETSVSLTPYIAGAFYALDFDRVEKTLLLGDAKDFQSNGEVRVYDLTGAPKRVIPAGVIPGAFWAK